ncbi:hypothetical protein DPMN_023029 [Dreissena polymorpha]|uniref:Uncharacterized protein n=1 Tax=Dreissena polymorpha TaxID=45954 RepID=A0A9D4LKA8_DREPO|nr:hypothetical protein DPMN_023029 [Dreissena polymorpha]
MCACLLFQTFYYPLALVPPYPSLTHTLQPTPLELGRSARYRTRYNGYRGYRMPMLRHLPDEVHNVGAGMGPDFMGSWVESTLSPVPEGARHDSERAVSALEPARRQVITDTVPYSNHDMTIKQTIGPFVKIVQWNQGSKEKELSENKPSQFLKQITTDKNMTIGFGIVDKGSAISDQLSFRLIEIPVGSLELPVPTLDLMLAPAVQASFNKSKVVVDLSPSPYSIEGVEFASVRQLEKGSINSPSEMVRSMRQMKDSGQSSEDKITELVRTSGDTLDGLSDGIFSVSKSAVDGSGSQSMSSGELLQVPLTDAVNGNFRRDASAPIGFDLLGIVDPTLGPSISDTSTVIVKDAGSEILVKSNLFEQGLNSASNDTRSVAETTQGDSFGTGLPYMKYLEAFGPGPYGNCRIPARVVCGAQIGWETVVGMDEWCRMNCVVFMYSTYCDDGRCQCKCTST